MTRIVVEQSPEAFTPTILVVDDDQSIVRLVSLLLGSEGFVVLKSEGGEAGLEVLAESQPDLLLLDLQMPELDGRAFYRRARLAGYLGPVIIFSSYGAEAAKLELGADRAIAKPFDPEELLRSVRELAVSG